MTPLLIFLSGAVSLSILIACLRDGADRRTARMLVGSGAVRTPVVRTKLMMKGDA
jgi:hypothetical protein